MATHVLSANRNPSPPGQDLVELSTSQLQEGVKLRFPVCDSRNILLLAAGSIITRTVIERLEQRGIKTVKVHRKDASRICRSGSVSRVQNVKGAYCPLETAHSRRLDADVDRRRAAKDSPAQTAFATEIVRHGTATYDPKLASQLIESHNESLTQMDQLFGALETCPAATADSFAAISEKNLKAIAADLDLFVSLGINSAPDKYPVRHGVQSSMLAMAIATTMGLDKQSVMDLGMGCLVHDVGMLHIDPHVFQKEAPLDSVEFLEITKHPILTFDMIRGVEQFSGGARLVAYQTHERCNGSGYPRHRTATQIHPLAKIAAVADVFVALVSPRPHRAGRMPYYAMEYLIREAKKGLFDPEVVRAMLRTISLFPIGSCIELNDGRPGRVIRASGEAYTKPIVEVWERDQLNMPATVVDLSAQTGIDISRPLPALTCAADVPLAEAKNDWD